MKPEGGKFAFFLFFVCLLGGVGFLGVGYHVLTVATWWYETMCGCSAIFIGSVVAYVACKEMHSIVTGGAVKKEENPAI